MEVNLWTAASDGDTNRVRHLLESGTHSTNDADETGYTCVHAAVSYAHSHLLAYLLTRPDVDVNAPDADGDTPLHVCEDVATAQTLIQAGADVKALNKNGFSPVRFLDSFETESYQADVARDEGYASLVAFLESLDAESGDGIEPVLKRRR